VLESVEFQVGVVAADGNRIPAVIVAQEGVADGKDINRIELTYGGRTIRAESDAGFFDALQKLRIDLESHGHLLWCFGTSEDVYPSPMQEAMGPAILAYRTKLGQQALSKDIVNIFESDESIKPATVAQQRAFHARWLRSLRP
jgi:hypothetical protein